MIPTIKSRNESSSSSSSSTGGSIVATAGVAFSAVAVGAAGIYFFYYSSKLIRSKWQDYEDKYYSHDTLPSIIEHFHDIKLNAETTVQEANQRRTVSYYQKAREAHSQSLVLGHTNYDKLLKRREDEMNRSLYYYNLGTKSHRTVIVMLDSMTRQLLHEARSKILAPLNYSLDITTKGVWISKLNMIPMQDMHVTIAIPWWWHTMREGNHDLSQAIANRFRQALVIDFHHPFQIELERIILLGGKTLVALWRTIGERIVCDDDDDEEEEENENGNYNMKKEKKPIIHIQDRHGTGIDPMVRLRREIVACFTTENEEIGRKPLTYFAHKQSFLEETETTTNPIPKTTTTTTTTQVGEGEGEGEADDKLTNKEKKEPTQIPVPEPITTFISSSSIVPIPEIPKPKPIQERQPTIESKTPGLGNGDGFIHTTLCRLPTLNCLSMDDVELEPIHRLCREATATYAGHRMIVSKFRFLETTGKGGESNPCIDPIFDESMDAPTRFVVDAVSGQVNVLGGAVQVVAAAANCRHATIGAPPDLNYNKNNEGGGIATVGIADGLFDKP